MFCDGDYWHDHNWALSGMSSIQEELSGYSEYWRNQIAKNVRRDEDTTAALIAKGWRKKSERSDFFRHTHASILLKQGVHPKIVQERLGHSDIQTTLNTYSHILPGLQEAAAKQFDSILTLPTKYAAERLD